MKTIVLFGAGQMGQAALRLLGYEYNVVAFCDNYEPKWGTELKGIRILSPDNAIALSPDCVCLCVIDDERRMQMSTQLSDMGYKGEIFDLSSLKIFDARNAVMSFLAEQINAYGVVGDIAELGVYRGDFAALLCREFCGTLERKLHLFDTFEGFIDKDVETEVQNDLSKAKAGDFSDTGIDIVLNRLPYISAAVIHKGWFPDTFKEIGDDTRFAFVSLDADLYEPTRAALTLFYDRLSPGGVILIHDVYNSRFSGCKKAVNEFCFGLGIFPTPVADLHGSAIIRK